MFTIALAVLMIVYVGIYNSLVGSRNKVREAWAGIDVQLKRRHDLIPNLIRTVQGYAKHESELLQKLTDQRAKAIAVPATNTVALASAESALAGTVRSVFAIAEQYPDLKANQNFLDLERQLADTEDQISASRRIYNGNVQIFNTAIQSVPSNVVAQLHHFEPASMFEITTDERATMADPVNVSF
jgi:LemA protein